MLCGNSDYLHFIYRQMIWDQILDSFLAIPGDCLGHKHCFCQDCGICVKLKSKCAPEGISLDHKINITVTQIQSLVCLQSSNTKLCSTLLF